jgi:Sulfotransferase domain
MAPLRLNLWSGPRNVSTALMYAFAQRPDTRVVDEPLYAHYLRVSGADHPGRDEVLRAQEQDGAHVIRDQLLGPADRPVVFFKQMTHHLVELDDRLLTELFRSSVNVLLIRDPREMLPSLTVQLPQAGLRDTGYAAAVELYEGLRALGQDPPVLEAEPLLRNPRGVLTELCRRIGIAFDERMLSWNPGPRPEDGVWAPHWYHNVHRSSSFEPYRPKREPLPARLEPLLAQCQPHYERLSRLAIRA